MARGPAPKKASLRQRRNKTKTAAILDDTRKNKVSAPDLEDRPCPRCAADITETEAAKQPPNRRGRRRKVKMPPPPPRGKPCGACGGTGTLLWHAYTIKAWEGLWASPQAEEYAEGVDTILIHIAFNLLDKIKWDGHAARREDIGELRMYAKELGLSVMSRRSLQWEKPERPKKEEPTLADLDDDTPDAEDPRNILRFETK